MQYYHRTMTPVLVRLDNKREVTRVLDDADVCTYCFPGAMEIDA